MPVEYSGVCVRGVRILGGLDKNIQLRVVSDPHIVHFLGFIARWCVIVFGCPCPDAIPCKAGLLVGTSVHDGTYGIREVGNDHGFPVPFTGCGWYEITFFMRPFFYVRMIRTLDAGKVSEILHFPEDLCRRRASYSPMTINDIVSGIKATSGITVTSVFRTHLEKTYSTSMNHSLSFTAFN